MFLFLAPIISQRGLVATSATFLKIRGLNFDPDNFPLVLLRFWDGPAGVTYGTQAVRDHANA
mgnify:CR=1 FL=1